MQDVKPGDVLLYAVVVREKGSLVRYYGCEVIGSISGGRPLNMSDEPVTGARAIYRRNGAASAQGQRRILLARHENVPDDNLLLSRELETLSGPGELVTGISCQSGLACGPR